MMISKMKIEIVSQRIPSAPHKFYYNYPYTTTNYLFSYSQLIRNLISITPLYSFRSIATYLLAYLLLVQQHLSTVSPWPFITHSKSVPLIKRHLQTSHTPYHLSPIVLTRIQHDSLNLPPFSLHSINFRLLGSTIPSSLELRRDLQQSRVIH